MLLPGPVMVTWLPGVAVPDTVGVVVVVPLLAGVMIATVGVPDTLMESPYVLLAVLSLGPPVTVPLTGT